MLERAVHELAGALSPAAASGAERCRTTGCAPGEPGERLRLRPHRGHADDRGFAGKRADFLGNPDLQHTYSYVPDIAAGLATLGTDDRAAGGVWHLPGPETVTTRQILALTAEEVGHPVDFRLMPKLLLRAIGLVNPMVRGLAEMAYQFEEPFVLDTSGVRPSPKTATPLDRSP